MKRADRLIPNCLRKFRLLNRYEQKEVARMLGHKSHANVSQWERGVAMPNLENLLRLSIIYRTLPDELYYSLRQELIKDIEDRRREIIVERDEGG